MVPRRPGGEGSKLLALVSPAARQNSSQAKLFRSRSSREQCTTQEMTNQALRPGAWAACELPAQEPDVAGGQSWARCLNKLPARAETPWRELPPMRVGRPPGRGREAGAATREWAHQTLRPTHEHGADGHGVATLLALCWQMSEASARRGERPRAAGVRTGRAPGGPARPGPAGPESLAVAAVDSLPALLAATAAAHHREKRVTERLWRRVRELESELSRAETSGRAMEQCLSDRSRSAAAWSLASGVAFHSVAPEARGASGALAQRVQDLEGEVELLRLELSRSLALLRRSATRLPSASPPRLAPPSPQDRGTPTPDPPRGSASWSVATAVLCHQCPREAPAGAARLRVARQRGVTIGPGAERKTTLRAPDSPEAVHERRVGHRRAAGRRTHDLPVGASRRSAPDQSVAERATGSRRRPRTDPPLEAPSILRAAAGAPHRPGPTRQHEGQGLANEWLARARAEARSHPGAGRRVDDLVRRATLASQRLLSSRAGDVATDEPGRGSSGSQRDATAFGRRPSFEMEPRGGRDTSNPGDDPPRSRIEVALERAAASALVCRRAEPAHASRRQGRARQDSHCRDNTGTDHRGVDSDGESGGDSGGYSDGDDFEGSDGEDVGENQPALERRGSARGSRSQGGRSSFVANEGGVGGPRRGVDEDEALDGIGDGSHSSGDSDNDDSEDEASGSDEGDSDGDSDTGWAELADKGVAGAFVRRPREVAAATAQS